MIQGLLIQSHLLMSRQPATGSRASLRFPRDAGRALADEQGVPVVLVHIDSPTAVSRQWHLEADVIAQPQRSLLNRPCTTVGHVDDGSST